MIRSMTGFGRSSFEVEHAAFSVEVRTLNHRHLDLSVRLPRVLSDREPEIKRRLQGRFGRGKIEVSVGLQSGGGATARLEVDLVVKGLRGVADFDSEMQMAQMNRSVGGVNTMFLPAKSGDDFIASKYIREITALHRMIVHAMKAKQTTDQEHVKQLSGLIHDLHHSYMGAEHKH